MARVEWHGAEIQSAINQAARIAVDQTMADCVLHAQLPYPIGARRDTSTMANNIRFRPSIRQGNVIVGRWGNMDGPHYALFWELRDKHLRRAADLLYPTLAERIQENM